MVKKRSASLTVLFAFALIPFASTGQDTGDFSVIVHRDNPLESINKARLSKMFLKNPPEPPWPEIG